jgi:cold shock CspA family protein
MARRKGTVARVITDKRFGFIAVEGVEYSFHRSACIDAVFDRLREGQAVSFEIGQECERTSCGERQH